MKQSKTIMAVVFGIVLTTIVRSFGAEITVAKWDDGLLLSDYGRTQVVRIALSVDESETSGSQVKTWLPRDREGGYSFLRIAPWESDVLKALQRAIKWAAEAKAQQLSVVDKPLLVSATKDDRSLLFFTENKGNDWGIKIKKLEGETVIIKNQHAAEFCQILNDLNTTTIKRQRLIENAKKALIEAGKLDEAKRNTGDGNKLTY